MNLMTKLALVVTLSGFAIFTYSSFNLDATLRLLTPLSAGVALMGYGFSSLIIGSSSKTELEKMLDIKIQGEATEE